MTGITTEVKIPDLWYDLYARLLPGSIFVGLIRYFFVGDKSVPGAAEVLMLALGAYLCGLAVHPLSARLSALVFRLAEKFHKKSKGFLFDVQHRLRTATPHDVSLLHKMHGEVAFFVQSSVLLFILALINWRFRFHDPWPGMALPLIAAAAAFLAATEVAERQIKRGIRLDKQWALTPEEPSVGATAGLSASHEGGQLREQTAPATSAKIPGPPAKL